MTTYRITKWQEHYEKNHKETEVVFRWVAVPTKHDGKGFRRIAGHKRAVEVFCAWNLILQTAAKMPVRGTLADENGPLDAQDLADSTGYPAAIFAIAFEVLIDPRVGWLQAEISPDLFGTSSANSTGQNRTRQNKKGATHPLPAAAGETTDRSHGTQIGALTEPTDDAIYRAYPRHVEPKAAKKAIHIAVAAIAKRGQPEPRAWLLHRTQLYAEARRQLAATDPDSVKYVPYPQKWFNRARYDDDPSEWGREHHSPSPSGNGGPGRVLRGQSELEMLDKAMS